MIEGKVKALFSDKERTELLFPITKTSAITNDDGVGLDAIISDTVYSDTNAIKATAVPVNADTLGGKPADEFATQNYVAAEIAKAQLNGGDVDLSGFVTKDDLNNFITKDDLGNLVGKNVAGEVFVVDDESIVASDGAEIFNDYENNIATGEYSHAEGCGTIATGDCSHAEGDYTQALDYADHAEGSSAIAMGGASHAEGDSTAAYGYGAHAEGSSTQAFDYADHAEGSSTSAKGGAGHAEGDTTVTYGYGAHAEGCFSIGYGDYSHAEGDAAFAYGLGSHAEGHSGDSVRVKITGETYSNVYTLDKAYDIEVRSQISCDYRNEDGISVHAGSLIISYDPDALTIEVEDSLNEDMDFSGQSALIFPGGIAYGDYSHVEGKGCIAGSEDQHVQGRYNIRDDDGIYAHIVGNGEQPYQQPVTRSNAHTLDWDGNAWFAGDVYVGSTSGNNKDEGSKKLATEDYVTTMAAPAGYGLGETTPKSVGSPDNALATGWYIVTDPVSGAGTGWLYCSSYSNQYKRQEFYNVTSSNKYVHVVRYMNGGIWEAWEWVNPPMIPGVEYRTTERYDGKAVYKKKVSVGAFPNATVKTFANLISGFTGIVDYQLTGYSSSAILHPTDPYYFNTVHAGITLNATSDLSAYSGIAYLAYTKD